jgi:hypothetical protein
MNRLSRSRRILAAGLLASLAGAAAFASPEAGSPGNTLTPLPSLNVPAYMGTWYQVAWFPNRFQQQCVSDTTAHYRQLPGGEGVEVTNRCRLADGKLDSVVGLARPAGSVLRVTNLSPPDSRSASCRVCCAGYPSGATIGYCSWPTTGAMPWSANPVAYTSGFWRAPQGWRQPTKLRYAPTSSSRDST